jgi:Ni/Co efflux regulator RcnB
MNSVSKALPCCLLLLSFAALANPFPETSRQSGEMMYRTGQPVPAQYLASDNVIQNYHHYHLDKPIDGYEWVHGVENDYLLVSTKSGILKRIEYRLNIPPESTSGK